MVKIAEKIWLKTKRDCDKEHYLHIDRVYMTHIYHSKKSHIINLLDNSKNRSRTLYIILRSFAKPEGNNSLPDINKKKVSDKFADYLLNKIEKIREHFKGKENIHHQLRPAPSYLTSNLLQKSQYSYPAHASYYMCSGSMKYNISNEIEGHTNLDNNKNHQHCPNYRAISR